MPARLTLIALFLTSLMADAAWAEKYRFTDVPPPPPQKKRKKVDPKDPEISPEEKRALMNEVVDEFYRKGMKAVSEGQYNQAEAFFDRVLILQPNHQGALDGINFVMKQLEQPEPAPSPKKDPKVTLVERLETEMDQAFKSGDMEEASGLAKKILAVDPDNRKAHQKRAAISRHLYLKAIQRAEEREAEGDLDGALDAYGMALSHRTDPAIVEKVASLKDRVRQRNAKRSEELYLEALNLSQNGEPDKALQLCTQALDLNPQNLQARRMHDRLLTKKTP